MLQMSRGFTGNWLWLRYCVGLAPVDSTASACSSSGPVGCLLSGYKQGVFWPTSWLCCRLMCFTMNSYSKHSVAPVMLNWYVNGVLIPTNVRTVTAKYMKFTVTYFLYRPARESSSIGVCTGEQKDCHKRTFSHTAEREQLLELAADVIVVTNWGEVGVLVMVYRQCSLLTNKNIVVRRCVLQQREQVDEWTVTNASDHPTR